MIIDNYEGCNVGGLGFGVRGGLGGLNLTLLSDIIYIYIVYRDSMIDRDWY